MQISLVFFLLNSTDLVVQGKLKHFCKEMHTKRKWYGFRVKINSQAKTKQ